MCASALDIPAILGVTLLVALIYVFLNLLVDLAQAMTMNPKMKVLIQQGYFDKLYEVNLRGPVRLAGLVAPHMAELALGACALLAWLLAEPGLLKAVAYNVVLIAGVSTVLVNGKVTVEQRKQLELGVAVGQDRKSVV